MISPSLSPSPLFSTAIRKDIFSLSLSPYCPVCVHNQLIRQWSHRVVYSSQLTYSRRLLPMCASVHVYSTAKEEQKAIVRQGLFSISDVIIIEWLISYAVSQQQLKEEERLADIWSHMVSYSHSELVVTAAADFLLSSSSYRALLLLVRKHS